MKKFFLASAAFLLVAVVAFYGGQLTRPMPRLSAQQGGVPTVGSFAFEIDGKEIPIIAISGMDSETEVIEDVESLPDGTFRVRKRPGRTKYGDIVLKRGFLSSSELYDWYQQVLRNSFEKKTGSLTLFDGQGTQMKRYEFLEIWPCGWSPSVQRGSSSQVLEERFSLKSERIEG